jgi:hypothetical protein
MPADSLRGRVEHQVDIIAGSANKVLLGVVDTSFGVLRSLLPLQGTAVTDPVVGDVPSEAAPWNRPGLGLLRRENGFSIASIAASLPGRAGTAKSIHSVDEESGQQLVAVSSRPSSIKSGAPRKDGELSEESGSSGSEDEDGEEQDEEDEEEGGDIAHDAKSIRSFESMMKGKKRSNGPRRRSLSDRLAHMSGLSKLGQGHHDGQKVSFAGLLSPAVYQTLFDDISHLRCCLPAQLTIALIPPFLRGVYPLSHFDLHHPFSDS